MISDCRQSPGVLRQQQPVRVNPAGLLQRSCVCGKHTIGGDECAECKRRRVDLQARVEVNQPGDRYEQEAELIASQVMAMQERSASSPVPARVQRLADRSADQTKPVPSSVTQALADPGRPLDPAVQRSMEQAFGHDFSRVRVHSGSVAERSARDVSAHAYTVGHDVVFGVGQYAPGTPRGQQLLAHELVHVLQQGSSIRPPALAVDAPGSSLERHADRLLAQVTAGGPIQRDPIPSAVPGLVLRHAADKTICPPPPLYRVVDAGPKDVHGPANDAIEQAYLDDSRHQGHAVLTGRQFEYGGNKEIRLPKGTPDRAASNAILSRLRGLVKQRAPDLMNFTERVFYEIKTPRYAVGGMVQLESYYALTEVIRMELGEAGGPPWDQGAATWYPPHVLPFPGNARRLVCTQMTDYSVTTPGLVLYVVLEKQREEEEEEKAQEAAKPAQEQKEATEKVPAEGARKGEGEGGESIIPEVAIGAGGAALTAATIAYLRKRALKQAERRAAQLAWRKMAEAAAARRAAQAAGKGAAGKAAGKAVAYAEIAAAAALIIFYSDRVEAKVGMGPSPLESLYKAMTTSGTPPSPELKKLIESDPLLRQLAEDAAASGDATPLQQEMTQRTLELIRDNPDQFTPEDLEFLMEYSKTAKAAGQAPQSVGELRKAIDAAKAGKTGQTGQAGKTGGEGKETADATARDATPQLSQATRDKLAGAPAPVQSLFKGMLGPKGAKLTDAHVERFLGIMPSGLTADQVAKLLEKRKPSEGETVDQVLDSLQAVLADLEKPAEAGPEAGPATPSDKPVGKTTGEETPAVTPPPGRDVTITTGPTVSGSKKSTPEEVIKRLAAAARKSKFADIARGTYEITWKREEKGLPKVGDVISGTMRGKLKTGTAYLGHVEAEVTTVKGRALTITFITATPMVSAEEKVVLQADQVVGRKDSVTLDPPAKRKAK